ncbi:DUF2384 domain-containing protein [Sphingomonas sp. MG17]|uniref:DUF2384 domain-containing protein n=1 Tax=Sphingomonas tagetis TaxID=2949092 RepID=A0A9X2KMW2_9SPHN|nr:DUF2384 domain-containing protein [Sphingomonas tagetis]
MIDQYHRSEVICLVNRLAELAERVGFKSWEVETLISVRHGVWPLSASRCEMWWPTEVQAQRIRALVEVCAGAVAMMGHDAAKWLRRRNVGLGQSPIGFLLSRANGLAEMHDLLLREAGQC